MRFLTFAILLGSAGAAPADILQLNDGSRYYGEVIDRNDSTVTFKVMFADGKSGVVRHFAVDRIVQGLEGDLAADRSLMLPQGHVDAA